MPWSCLLAWCGCLNKLFNSSFQLIQQLTRHLFFFLHRMLTDLLPDFGVVRIHITIERGLPFADLVDWRTVQIPVSGGKDDHYLFLDRHWPVRSANGRPRSIVIWMRTTPKSGR